MRLAKCAFTTLFGALLLIDAIVAFRLVRYGWPKRLIGTTVDNVAQVQAIPIPMDGTAWISFGLYVMAHVILAYGIWRAWSRPTGHGPDL